MDTKVTNILMVVIALVVFGVLTYSVVINTDKEVTTKIIEAFLILASNICTFFFTKHQIGKVANSKN